jgi:hypothetical protein
MYSPTKWQRIKDILRFWFCRHKHTEVRTVSGGSDGEEMLVLTRFRYCLDCKNTIYDKDLEGE